MFYRFRLTLPQAILLSLLIHGAFLLLANVHSATRPAVFEAPPGLQIRLVDHIATASREFRPLPKPKEIATQVKPVSRSVPVQDRAEVSRTENTVSSLFRSDSANAGQRTSQDSVGVAPVQAPGGGVKTDDAVAEDDLFRYRIALSRVALQYKRYPALAREREWEGTAEVALRANSAGDAPEIILARTSGRTVLDEQAREMISRAAQRVPLPSGLQGKQFKVVLPVRFSLEDVQ